MKSILFAIPLALAICVSPCLAQETETSSDTQDFAKMAKLLHGNWAGDADKTAEEIKAMEDPGMEEAMIDMVLEQVKLIQITFQDGTFMVMINDQEMTGTWEVTGAEEKDGKQAVMIHVAPDEEAAGEEKNFEIHIMGDTHMKMIDLDMEGPPLVMQRKDEDSDD